ncbi:hypothetical protein [Cupriavidus malaysiensis]|uniref:hypothetical protein n=1 Tax=Cupriavidus malaysiensis TaxID=367825 RepID=UPI0012FF60CA|nr:hypothetical protein [Cupriavidus malaysiensis]
MAALGIGTRLHELAVADPYGPFPSTFAQTENGLIPLRVGWGSFGMLDTFRAGKKLVQCPQWYFRHISAFFADYECRILTRMGVDSAKQQQPDPQARRGFPGDGIGEKNVT